MQRHPCKESGKKTLSRVQMSCEDSMEEKGRIAMKWGTAECGRKDWVGIWFTVALRCT
jgi:hypothetical protein